MRATGYILIIIATVTYCFLVSIKLQVTNMTALFLQNIEILVNNYCTSGRSYMWLQNNLFHKPRKLIRDKIFLNINENITKFMHYLYNICLQCDNNCYYVCIHNHFNQILPSTLHVFLYGSLKIKYLFNSESPQYNTTFLSWVK